MKLNVEDAKQYLAWYMTFFSTLTVCQLEWVCTKKWVLINSQFWKLNDSSQNMYFLETPRKVFLRFDKLLETSNKTAHYMAAST